MSKLLDDIETYMAARGIGAHRFGILAINNGRLVERLQDGGRVWPETEKAIRAYMKANPPNRNSDKAA